MKKHELGKRIEEILETIVRACETIQEKGGCYKCPISHNCLDEYMFNDTASSTLSEDWETFLRYADYMSNYISFEDAEALHADDERKMAIEEAMIDEISE